MLPPYLLANSCFARPLSQERKQHNVDLTQSVRSEEYLRPQEEHLDAQLSICGLVKHSKVFLGNSKMAVRIEHSKAQKYVKDSSMLQRGATLSNGLGGLGSRCGAYWRSCMTRYPIEQTLGTPTKLAACSQRRQPCKCLSNGSGVISSVKR